MATQAREWVEARYCSILDEDDGEDDDARGPERSAVPRTAAPSHDRGTAERPPPAEVAPWQALAARTRRAPMPGEVYRNSDRLTI